MSSKKKTELEPSDTTETEDNLVTDETKLETAKKEAAALVPEPTFEKSIASKIVSKFGTKAVIGFIKPNRIRINTKKEEILDVASFIRDELNFDHAEAVSGVDYPQSKEIEVVYHLGSYSDPKLEKQILTLATRLPREDVPNPGKDRTRMPSLRDIFYKIGRAHV